MSEIEIGDEGWVARKKPGQKEAEQWLGDQLRENGLSEENVLSALGEFMAELQQSEGEEPMEVARHVLENYVG